MLSLPYPADNYEFTSEEIKETHFRIDGLLKSNDISQPLIFIEVQHHPDYDFYGRFFSEIFLYLYKNKTRCSWLAVAIYESRTVEKTPGIDFAPLLDLPQVLRIYLEDYRYNPDPVYAILQLIICEQTESVAIAQKLFQQRQQLNQDAVEFIETILVYKLRHYTRE